MSTPYLICERVEGSAQPTEACMTVYCAHCREPMWGLVRHAKAATEAVTAICRQCALQLK